MSYNKPNVKKQRLRTPWFEILNKEFITEFKKEFPKYNNHNYKGLTNIIKKSQEPIRNIIINNRDGIQLPEKLGNIFIMSKRLVNKPTDYKRSMELGKKVFHENYETDGYTGKVIYTNYNMRNMFKFNNLWQFNTGRKLKRIIAKEYPLKWNMYRILESSLRISNIIIKEKGKDDYKEFMKDFETTYQDFTLD